jgi:hypothetical protein
MKEMPETSHVEDGLEPNTMYTFQVSALDAQGNESVPSPAMSVQTGWEMPVSVSVQVAASFDDAEELTASGAVNLASADLDLLESGPDPQVIGIRFADVDVPQGATILDARVQFTADEVSAGSASLTIQAEASDDALSFTNAMGDVSSRPTTGTAVVWNPPDWTAVGAAGPDERTPDLAAVLQDVVARPGWSAGNAMALVISGSGSRVAGSYDGAAAAAPVLELQYVPEPGSLVLLISGIAGLLTLGRSRMRS